MTLLISITQLLFYLAVFTVIKKEDLTDKPARIAMWMLVAMISISSLEVIYLLS